MGLGVFAPQATPVPVVAKISRDVNTALRDSTLRQQLTAEGVDATESTPDRFRARLVADVGQAGRLLRQLNIKLD